jgi:hypothetical protein
MDDQSIETEEQLDQTSIDDQQPTPDDIKAADEFSAPHVGRWNELVSTTNWDKGQIIAQWREDLIKSEAHPAEYSDEAWARRVGGITGQHVGRLRRVHVRFESMVKKYQGLYWSHFQAAIDWEDAEMWLEGATQSSWSVSQMRKTRWETLGAPPELKPKDEDIIVSDVDEDYEPAINQSPTDPSGKPIPEGPDFGDEDSSELGDSGAAIYADDDEDAKISFVRPFENLPDLPDDLNEAFDSFKLAILRHKGEKWAEISRDDALASLDALKELCMAPAADDPSF